eukprot:CAMPEP_0196804098 /NCGR_PEP_ID=MMETSP1362-20130617/3615_1 /TAXON_ID=163516 /ORGANISM="Leptocylindrus danicus, Strain CCMP1856" /LENGTH=665 /DNA_ID=CAMNT_0042176121 /DNA_START=29 /DNA_END=2023 /DNA_ORIENTATION=-
MSKPNAWGQTAAPPTTAAKPSFASILQEQQEEGKNSKILQNQEDELILQAIEASLLDIRVVASGEDICNDDDASSAVVYAAEHEDEMIVRPGTVTAVDESVLPMLKATQIDSEDSEDEAENRAKGVIYTEVLATAPIHPDEMEALEKKCEEDLQATLKFLEDEKRQMRKLKKQQQQDEDASLALIIQLQEEEERRLLQSQRNKSGGQNNQHQKIQFVSSFAAATAQDEKFYDEDDCDEDDYDDEGEGYRINSMKKQKWKSLDGMSIVGPDGERRTKHDVALKNKSNAHRLGLKESSVSDKAYNSLRSKLKKEVVKGVASHGHVQNKASTREGALDEATMRCVQRAINCGVIEGMNGAVKEGKEAIVYHADGPSGKPDVAVKVFKRIQEFRKRGEYVDGDSRYFGQKFASLDKRGQLELWAEKEFRNLTRANYAGVPSPLPLAHRENTLFMQFLGNDCWPAPQLREVEIKHGSKKWLHLYFEVLVAVKKLYHSARLVHGDLSEYNILLVSKGNVIVEDEDDSKIAAASPEDEKKTLTIVLIDFAQAVERKHPRAESFLRRDLQQVSVFFRKRGIRVLDEDVARDYITENINLKAKVSAVSETHINADRIAETTLETIYDEDMTADGKSNSLDDEVKKVEEDKVGNAEVALDGEEDTQDELKGTKKW